MGDPRKHRKKYETPTHPWQKDRIDKEKIILKEYGLRNKKELWRSESRLRKFTTQAKKLISSTTKQAEKEKKDLLIKLFRYNLIEKDAKLEDVLNLSINNILDRRLQTIVYKKGLSHSQKQARQFITHRHITVNDKLVTIPSYLVSKDEEDKIGFRPNSNIAKVMKEASKKEKPQKAEKKDVKEEKKTKKSKDTEKETKKPVKTKEK